MPGWPSWRRRKRKRPSAARAAGDRIIEGLEAERRALALTDRERFVGEALRRLSAEATAGGAAAGRGAGRRPLRREAGPRGGARRRRGARPAAGGGPADQGQPAHAPRRRTRPRSPSSTRFCVPAPSTRRPMPAPRGSLRPDAGGEPRLVGRRGSRPSRLWPRGRRRLPQVRGGDHLGAPGLGGRLGRSGRKPASSRSPTSSPPWRRRRCARPIR